MPLMRPMKLAGEQLMFGQGSLAYLENLSCQRAMIITGGSSMKKSGILDLVCSHLERSGAKTCVFAGVEPDPSFETVLRGAQAMTDFEPDWIIALGGGSPMDAAKTMWVYYEHPELKTLEDMLHASPFPKLRNKARLCCIPSTAGSASEVSRSVVITQAGKKYGFGNMELMPDLAICDPAVTRTLPARITAETGMDALTHALEALTSTRSNYLSDVLAQKAALDILKTLPIAAKDGENIAARETMLNASMLAGLAFTNVSLGITHSMAHSLGGAFHIAHGLADAILLPYVMRFNQTDERASGIYRNIACAAGGEDLIRMVEQLNAELGIPGTLAAVIPDQAAFFAQLETLSAESLADGCTKTNPIIPTAEQFSELLVTAYHGGDCACR